MTFMWLMFSLAGLFAIVAGLAYARVVLAAFQSSRKQGFLSLLLPGYALFFAFARMLHPRKALVLGTWLGGAALAGLCVQLSTAYAPQPDAQAEVAFEDLEGFDDFGDFDDLDEDL